MGREEKGEREGKTGEGRRGRGGEGTGREAPPIFYCTPRSSSFLEICLASRTTCTCK